MVPLLYVSCPGAPVAVGGNNAAEPFRGGVSFFEEFEAVEPLLVVVELFVLEELLLLFLPGEWGSDLEVLLLLLVLLEDSLKLP